MRIVLLSLLLIGCGRLSFTGTSSTDAGRTDTTVPADVGAADAVPPSICGTAGAMVCDGFEGTTFDAMWTVDTSSGTVDLDTTRAYRGSASAHAHIDQITSAITDPRALLYGTAGLTSPVTGSIYVRAWIYVASPLSSSTYLNQMINLADIGGNGISTGARNGVVANNDYTAQLYGESATAFPHDRWACLQFEIPSNTSGTSRVFLDGTELTDIALTKATTQPPPSHIYVGLEWVGSPSTMPAADAWLDELIVDTKPTTCAQ